MPISQEERCNIELFVEASETFPASVVAQAAYLVLKKSLSEGFVGLSANRFAVEEIFERAVKAHQRHGVLRNLSEGLVMGILEVEARAIEDFKGLDYSQLNEILAAYDRFGRDSEGEECYRRWVYERFLARKFL